MTRVRVRKGSSVLGEGEEEGEAVISEEEVVVEVGDGVVVGADLDVEAAEVEVGFEEDVAEGVEEGVGFVSAFDSSFDSSLGSESSFGWSLDSSFVSAGFSSSVSPFVSAFVSTTFHSSSFPTAPSCSGRMH